MAFTNKDLVAHAQKALSEKWGYCLGSFGNVLTDTFLKQKCSQDGGVGTYNTNHKDYLLQFRDKRVTDCYGLVKSYLWWNGGNVQYKAAQDRNQETAFNVAKEKGTINAIPEIPGLVLWMKGHAGIYIGNGEFIECAGAPTGMRKGKIENGKVVSGSRFTHWFKDTYITYEEPKKTPEPEQPTVKFNLFGTKEVEIPGQLIDGSNYVQARALLEAMEFIVDWDAQSKTVLVSKAGK